MAYPQSPYRLAHRPDPNPCLRPGSRGAGSRSRTGSCGISPPDISTASRHTAGNRRRTPAGTEATACARARQSPFEHFPIREIHTRVQCHIQRCRGSWDRDRSVPRVRIPAFRIESIAIADAHGSLAPIQDSLGGGMPRRQLLVPVVFRLALRPGAGSVPAVMRGNRPAHASAPYSTRSKPDCSWGEQRSISTVVTVPTTCLSGMASLFANRPLYLFQKPVSSFFPDFATEPSHATRVP